MWFYSNDFAAGVLFCSNHGLNQDKTSVTFGSGEWALGDDTDNYSRSPLCEVEWICPAGSYCVASGSQVSEAQCRLSASHGVSAVCRLAYLLTPSMHVFVCEHDLRCCVPQARTAFLGRPRAPLVPRDGTVQLQACAR